MSPTLGVGTLRSQNGNTGVCPERVVFSGAPPDHPGGMLEGVEDGLGTDVANSRGSSLTDAM